MKYVYLVFMNPYDIKGSSQGKTLLGVHTSRKSAMRHFNAIADDRAKQRDYAGLRGSYGAEISPPDWVYKRLSSISIDYKRPEPGVTCPDWYTTSEVIEVEQWKVSRPKTKKGRRK